MKLSGIRLLRCSLYLLLNRIWVQNEERVLHERESVTVEVSDNIVRIVDDA